MGFLVTYLLLQINYLTRFFSGRKRLISGEASDPDAQWHDDNHNRNQVQLQYKYSCMGRICKGIQTTAFCEARVLTTVPLRSAIHVQV